MNDNRGFLSTLLSPTGLLEFVLSQSPSGRLAFVLSKTGEADCKIVENASLGISVDGIDLGDRSVAGVPIPGERDESYPSRGWHSVARDRARTLTLPFTHAETGTHWTLEVRLFDDGVAYRYVVPDAGSAKRTVNGEASSWTMPARSKVWLAERNNDWKLKSYAGWWIKTDLSDLPGVSSQGPVQMMPLVFELPQGGYAVLGEAALANYSGMRLRATGKDTITADFHEGEAGFSLEGDIVSPWRVVLYSPDLNGLVNSDIWTNLNPPADDVLFADTSWIKTGRCAWRWWSTGLAGPAEEREYVDYAERLGWEFSLVDDGWERWPDKWGAIAGLAEYGRSKGIGVLVWKDYNDVVFNPASDYAELDAFLENCRLAGVAGVKIDFMNAESLDRIQFQRAAHIKTAQRRLLLLFHGCQKPTGEWRTFPNEVTREAIRGLELNKMSEGPIYPSHNAALPFTRYLMGHGDYTPVGFSDPGPTTWGQQLATVFLFTSPFNVIAEGLDYILDNPGTRPALGVLKALPTTWDETVVMPQSVIGELAIMARRSGDVWYLAGLTGDNPAEALELEAGFLTAGRSYACELIATGGTLASLVSTERPQIASTDGLAVNLAAADGFVAVFRPVP
ncbi:MAG: glycoside hydrolase family 97 catalytic domain-containing protein [Capsulimonadaceae bacterium]|nr:glycoside hydrolase family 97 catalytic domain-containing protein [Capsulimonadaceae bacterium]